MVVTVVCHTVVVLALAGAYTALTVTGHDANGVLGLLGGYLGGAAVQTGLSSR